MSIWRPAGAEAFAHIAVTGERTASSAYGRGRWRRIPGIAARSRPRRPPGWRQTGRAPGARKAKRPAALGWRPRKQAYATQQPPTRRAGAQRKPTAYAAGGCLANCSRSERSMGIDLQNAERCLPRQRGLSPRDCVRPGRSRRRQPSRQRPVRRLTPWRCRHWRRGPAGWRESAPRSVAASAGWRRRWRRSPRPARSQ